MHKALVEMRMIGSELCVIFVEYKHMSNKELNIRNKRARFEYHLIENFVAGVRLSGTEIKSIRNGKASILEAYCVMQDGEVFVRNMHVSEYENASFYSHKPRADRKLLLNKKEINRIKKHLLVKGNTMIPLKLFLSEKGWLKMEVALAQGKKLHDKRQDLKAKDDQRDMDRAMKR
jgi:SsrA-binding protein